MKSAILMLACSDYEALEISLACHGAYMPENTPFIILQNCRGSYDAERNLQAVRRFQQQYPKNVIIVDHIPPGPPYRAILAILKDPIFRDIDFVCKVDDDAYPVTQGWFKKIEQSYLRALENGSNIAYATPLINNNTWGFSEVMEVMKLKDEFYSSIATVHRVGSGASDNGYVILNKHEISTKANGTIWANPHVARWIHEKTTLVPDAFIRSTSELCDKDVPSEERYSIGCIFFKKELWTEVDDGGSDDEHMFHKYCREKKARIICTRSVPFVHLAYFSQREENRDIIPKVRQVYEQRLGLPWPIALHVTRELEIEARLRYLQNRESGLSRAPTGINSSNSNITGMSPDEFAIKAAKGLINATLRKLRLKK